MTRLFFIVAILTISRVTFAQSQEYQQSMQTALGKFQQISSVADVQQLGNQFQMIANAEPTEWLPLYYQAQCFILMSFMEPTDTTKKESYLDEAEKILNKLTETVPNESEVNTLQAFFYVGRLVINPMERGMQYSSMASTSLEKALALEPGNPRAKMMKLQLDMGAAPYMGQDPKSYCPEAKELMAKWDEYVPKSPLYPMWGKDQMAGILKGCE